MTYTAIVRQRGQLTIPDGLRRDLDWLKEGEAVALEISGEELRVKPKAKNEKKKVDWGQLWKHMELSRSFKGIKDDISMSQFVIEDRKRH